LARASDPILAREVATRIVRVLREAGHIAYFAGGCVRDALLNLHPTDYDVATDATPNTVRGLFRSTDAVGASFGVVLVHERTPAGRVTVEVATFRSDGPYSDARRPDAVKFSDPPSDAARRDFTINALFLDPLAPAGPGGEPAIIDFVNGLADLRAGVIRAVGDPEQRLAEDHLRALRAVRFAARLGFVIEPGTAAAIARHASQLRGVSRERIGEELRRMLEHPRRAEACGMLQRLGLDGPVLGESGRAQVALTLLGGLVGTSDPMLALAAWVLDRESAAAMGLGDQALADVVRRLRAALCLSNDESAALAGVLSTHQRVLRAWTSAAVAQRKRLASSAWFEGSLRLVAITHPELADSVRDDVNRLEGDGVGLAPEPVVTGDDLIAAGFRPGPAFRRILEGVYDAQLEGRVRDRGSGLELAARLNV
jgi:tRNA nucleotidyltransferase/poly(A) polymerase